MRLDKLLSFKLSDLLIPIRFPNDPLKAWPDGTKNHVLAHAVGGAVWWLAGLLLLHGAASAVQPVFEIYDISTWFPWGAVVVAFVEQVRWQFDLEEMHSTAKMNLPIWSMVWDIVTSTVAASVLAILASPWL